MICNVERQNLKKIFENFEKVDCNSNAIILKIQYQNVD